MQINKDDQILKKICVSQVAAATLLNDILTDISIGKKAQMPSKQNVILVESEIAAFTRQYISMVHPNFETEDYSAEIRNFAKALSAKIYASPSKKPSEFYRLILIESDNFAQSLKPKSVK